jgi:NTE family protein
MRPDDARLRAAVEPVRRLPGEEDDPEPTTGTALCLSGGGFRAMLFHAGVLWRMVETGHLARLDRISSVSGGSITAAQLGLRWESLRLGSEGAAQRFEHEVIEPLRELARHTIDVQAVIVGLATLGAIGEHVAGAYRDRLFAGRTLQDLPDAPRFVINATNVGSGALWRFSKEYMADWRVGCIESPDVELAVAVACSSAFPPVLSPYRLDVQDATWTTEPANDLTGPEFRDEAVLSDGGVYDNLGLETAWKRCRTVLVSDAGGLMAPDADPAADWALHTLRVLKVIDNQVRTLRKRQIIGALTAGTRDGVYLGIRSDITHYEAPDALPCPAAKTLALADTPTRLARLDDERQRRLINWGYAICDAGLRAHVDPGLDAPGGFPYAEAGVGGSAL